MRKNLIYLVLISIFLFSCSNEKKEKTDTNDNIKIDNNISLAQNQNLIYKFSEGDQINFKLTTFSNNSQFIQSDSSFETSMTQSISYLVDLNVNELEKNGDFNIDVNIKEISISGNLSGMPFSYNSSDNLPDKEKQQFMEYDILANAPYKIKLSAKGDILEVSNVEKIASRLLDAQGKSSVSINERLGTIRNIKEGAVKPLTQQMFRILPKQKVNIDSSWSFDYTTPLALFQITNKAIFKVKSFEKFASDTLAKIDASLEMEFNGNNRTVQNGIEYTFSEPKVSGQGYIDFNISKGFVQKSETSTKMEISMMMTGKDQSGSVKSAAEKDVTITTNVLELLSYSRKQVAAK